MDYSQFSDNELSQLYWMESLQVAKTTQMIRITCYSLVHATQTPEWESWEGKIKLNANNKVALLEIGFDLINMLPTNTDES